MDFQRFTDRARKVFQLANQEAQRFNHEYVGTEHILLGLVKEGSGVAAQVLKNLDVDVRVIRLEVEKLVKSGPNMITMGRLPLTPRVLKVCEFAVEESNLLGHSYVGTEHILLGLLREQPDWSYTVAQGVLKKLGLTVGQVRAEIMLLLGVKRDEEAGALKQHDLPPNMEETLKRWAKTVTVFTTVKEARAALKAEIVAEVLAQLRAERCTVTTVTNTLRSLDPQPLLDEVIVAEGPTDAEAMSRRLAMLDQSLLERDQLAQGVLQIRAIVAAHGAGAASDMDPMAALQKIERVLEGLP